MIKYIQNQGFKFTDKSNDMINNQFYLVNVDYEVSDLTTFSNVLLDRTEVYELFVNNFTQDKFNIKLINILTDAIEDGIRLEFDAITINVIKEENGHRVTMNFVIKG